MSAHSASQIRRRAPKFDDLRGLRKAVKAGFAAHLKRNPDAAVAEAARLRGNPFLKKTPNL